MNRKFLTKLFVQFVYLTLTKIYPHSIDGIHEVQNAHLRLNRKLRQKPSFHSLFIWRWISLLIFLCWHGNVRKGCVTLLSWLRLNPAYLNEVILAPYTYIDCWLGLHFFLFLHLHFIPSSVILLCDDLQDVRNAHLQLHWKLRKNPLLIFWKIKSYMISKICSEHIFFVPRPDVFLPKNRLVLFHTCYGTPTNMVIYMELWIILRK